MSAPRDSMWVAHEWRRTWGLTRSARSDPVGVLLDHAERPHPGEPAAADVEEDGVGVAADLPLLRLEMGPPLAGQPLLERGQRQPSQGHHPLLAPLAQDPDERGAAAVDRLGHVAQVQADHLADPRPGPVQQLEQGPVAQHGRPGAHHGAEQAARLVLAEGLGQAGRPRRPRVCRPSGRRWPPPPRPRSDGSPAASRGTGPRWPRSGCGAGRPRRPPRRRAWRRRSRRPSPTSLRHEGLVGSQVPAVGGQRARGAPPLHVQPREVLLRVAGQGRGHGVGGHGVGGDRGGPGPGAGRARSSRPPGCRRPPTTRRRRGRSSRSS